jgi:hypothetical protein
MKSMKSYVFSTVLGLSILASPAFAQRDLEFEGRQYGFCVDGIESRLPAKDAKNLLWWKDDCAAKYEALGAEGQQRPEVAAKKKRYDEMMPQVDAIAGDMMKAEAAKNAAKDAVEGRIWGDSAVEKLTSGQTELLFQKVAILQKGIEHYKTCLAKIELAAKGDPKFMKEGDPSADSDWPGDKLKPHCQAGLKKLESGIVEFKKKWVAEGKVKAGQIQKDYGTLDAEEKHLSKIVTSKDPLEALDIYNSYKYLNENGRMLRDALDTLGQQYNFFLEEDVIKGMSHEAMMKQATAWVDKGVEGQKEWEGKAQTAQNMYVKELLKVLSGDKAKLVKREGTPSLWDLGFGHSAARARLKLYAKSKWFRYDGNGCQTTYYFSGMKITKTKKEGYGCRG